MSSALLRQALEFVDQEGESDKKSVKRRVRSTGQASKSPQTGRVKKRVARKESDAPSQEDIVKRLLVLSKPVADKAIADKIVERAVKGKPLSDFIPVPKNQKEKSILFPDEEEFDKFEEELFCS